MQGNKIFRENIENRNIIIDTNLTAEEKNKVIAKAKKQMNLSIKKETLLYWNKKKVQKLVLQEGFINLLIEEKSNLTWKSISNNKPKGVLSFALIASIHGLNTLDNLKRWGASELDKCTICGNYGNLEHILNWCTIGLNQGGF